MSELLRMGFHERGRGGRGGVKVEGEKCGGGKVRKRRCELLAFYIPFLSLFSFFFNFNYLFQFF